MFMSSHKKHRVSDGFVDQVFFSAAIFTRPDPSRLNFTNKSHSVPLSLICDNIRDPGNLGTILRCAAAAGCHNVLLTKGMLILSLKKWHIKLH